VARHVARPHWCRCRNRQGAAGNARGRAGVRSPQTGSSCRGKVCESLLGGPESRWTIPPDRVPIRVGRVMPKSVAQFLAQRLDLQPGTPDFGQRLPGPRKTAGSEGRSPRWVGRTLWSRVARLGPAMAHRPPGRRSPVERGPAGWSHLVPPRCRSSRAGSGSPAGAPDHVGIPKDRSGRA